MTGITKGHREWGALGMGHGAGALGMGHWAWGIGHGEKFKYQA
jgi:hypothetical protein